MRTNGKNSLEIKIDEKNEHLLNTKWYLDKDGYAITREGIKMHRIIMNPPKNMVVDHINHDKLDNREENLRIVTRQVNARNRKKVTGVFKRNDTGKWQAQIMHNYKNIRLGCYDTYEEALKARKDAEVRMWSNE
jgi:hypothetical protein